MRATPTRPVHVWSEKSVSGARQYVYSESMRATGSRIIV